MGGSNERLKYYLTNQSGRFSPEAVLSLSTVYTTPRGISTRTDAFLSIVRQAFLLHPSRSCKSYTCICLVGHYGEYSFFSSFSFLAAAISSPCILRVPRLRPLACIFCTPSIPTTKVLIAILHSKFNDNALTLAPTQSRLSLLTKSTIASNFRSFLMI